MKLPEPRFNRDGSYRIENDRDRIAVCVSTLRNILSAQQSYQSQGPAAVIDAMRHCAAHVLAQLEGLTFTRK